MPRYRSHKHKHHYTESEEEHKKKNTGGFLNYLYGKNYSDEDESIEKSYGAYSGSYSGDEDSDNGRYYKSSKKNLSKKSKNLDFHHGGHHHHDRCAYQHFDSTSDGTSSTTSSSSMGEMMETKCGYSSHSGSYSSGSSHEHHHHKKSMSTSSSKSKKLDKKLNKNNDLEEHVVFYSFHYLANSKEKNDVVIKSENLYCPKSSNPEDIERLSHKKSNLTKRASKNSDIITNMKITLTSDYPGILKLEFPTCKSYKSSGFEGEDFISHLIIPESNKNNLNNNETKSQPTILIDRKLDDGQKEFLLKYPGHTEENFREFNKESPGKKMVNVGLKPQESCIMHFFNKLPENQLSRSKKLSILNENISKRGDYIAFPLKLYKKLETTAELTLKNNFSFSDVTSNEFNIRIKPMINSQKQRLIQTKIDKFERNNQTEQAKHLKQLLNAPGFSNYYASSQSLTGDETSFNQFTKKGIYYSITGQIEISYLQIKSKIENTDEDFNLNNNKKMNNKSSSYNYKKNSYYYGKKRY